MVLAKLPVPGRPTILIGVQQGPIAWDGLDMFTLLSFLLFLSLFGRRPDID